MNSYLLDNRLEISGLVVLMLTGSLWNCLNVILITLHLRKAGSGHQFAPLLLTISISNCIMELSVLSLLILLWNGVIFMLNYFAVFKTTIVFWLNSCFMSFWSIAWLSLLYSVNIISNSAFCSRMRENTHTLVPLSLLVTMLTSAVVLTPIASMTDPLRSCNITQNVTYMYLWSGFPAWLDFYLYSTVVTSFLCSIPLVVLLGASLRLLLYLLQHMQAMKRNNTEIKSTDSYRHICRLIFCLMAIYLITLAGLAVCLMSESEETYRMVYSGMFVVCSFFCLATGILITVSNRQYKLILSDICCRRNEQRPQSNTPMHIAE